MTLYEKKKENSETEFTSNIFTWLLGIIICFLLISTIALGSPYEIYWIFFEFMSYIIDNR